MKKNHALATLLLVGIVSYAQNESLNLKKYWQYREKFKKHFVFYDETMPKNISQKSYGGGVPSNHIKIVSLFNGEDGGCEKNLLSSTLPPEERTLGGRGFGDAMANYDAYLGFLATEYKLLKNEGADVSSVLNELYYALYSADRMDKRSDAYLDQDPSMADNADGFFLRDDVEEKMSEVYLDEYPYSQDTRDRYRCIASDAHVINVFDHGQGGATSQFNERNFMSRDQVIGLIFGLRFVQKLVDNVYVKPLPTDEGFYIIDKVKELADRMANNITASHITHEDPTFRITRNLKFHNPFPSNPNTYKAEKLADMALQSWPFLKACELITGKTYDKSLHYDIKWKYAIGSQTFVNNLVSLDTDLENFWTAIGQINGLAVYKGSVNAGTVAY